MYVYSFSRLLNEFYTIVSVQHAHRPIKALIRRTRGVRYASNTDVVHRTKKTAKPTSAIVARVTQFYPDAYSEHSDVFVIRFPGRNIWTISPVLVRRVRESA